MFRETSERAYDSKTAAGRVLCRDLSDHGLDRWRVVYMDRSDD